MAYPTYVHPTHTVYPLSSPLAAYHNGPVTSVTTST
jgi:hypothetical protein